MSAILLHVQCDLIQLHTAIGIAEIERVWVQVGSAAISRLAEVLYSNVRSCPLNCILSTLVFMRNMVLPNCCMFHQWWEPKCKSRPGSRIDPTFYEIFKPPQYLQPGGMNISCPRERCSLIVIVFCISRNQHRSAGRKSHF